MSPASPVTLGVLAAAVVAGAGLGVPLVRRGLRELSISNSQQTGRLASRFAVAAGGAGAVLAICRAGSWWLLPALLVWGYALSVGAVCDAIAQRIPTPLVRQATAAVVVLLALGSWPAHEERHVVIALAASMCAGLIMLFCWRFLGAGFGDVRFGVLGGLGLGHVGAIGLASGVTAFALVILDQAIASRARHNRTAQIPYGPALAIGFLLAAAL